MASGAAPIDARQGRFTHWVALARRLVLLERPALGLVFVGGWSSPSGVALELARALFRVHGHGVSVIQCRPQDRLGEGSAVSWGGIQQRTVKSGLAHIRWAGGAGGRIPLEVLAQQLRSERGQSAQVLCDCFGAEGALQGLLSDLDGVVAFARAGSARPGALLEIKARVPEDRLLGVVLVHSE